MIFYYLGIDHKNASLEEREKAYSLRHDIRKFWQFRSGKAEILFTCNRVEIYAVATSVLAANANITAFKKSFPGIFGKARIGLGKHSVSRHFLSLSVGLVSRILGEKQIVKQLDSWLRQNGFDPDLREYLKGILYKGHEIRKRLLYDTYISGDIADIVIKDVLSKTGPLKGKKVLIIGTGKVAQLFAGKRIEGADIYIVARKKHSRAKRLAEWMGGQAVLFTEANDLMRSADIVISATSSPHRVIKSFPSGMNKKVRVYDLAVPRDIDPSVGEKWNIDLINIDDLSGLIDKRNDMLYEYAKEARDLVERTIEELKAEENRYADKTRNTLQPVGA
ncbi:MAG: NAD(P)-dependent oxidoreductase [Candidatus Aadella gelida]|nr:NAD(P)-dependent oxidoreductase [Candidatus Aadella gelida]